MYPSEQTFSKEVDERANAYFQAIYNRGVGVDSLLDLLKQFKDSPNKKERVCNYVPFLRSIIIFISFHSFFLTGFVCLYATEHV